MFEPLPAWFAEHWHRLLLARPTLINPRLRFSVTCKTEEFAIPDEGSPEALPDGPGGSERTAR